MDGPFCHEKRAPEEKLLLVPACQSKQGETLLERRQDNGKENRFVTTPTAHWKRRGYSRFIMGVWKSTLSQ